MDREASVRYLAARRMTKGGYRVRVRVVMMRGERHRTQHLFGKGSKVSLCGEEKARDTIAESVSALRTMCPACMGAPAFQEAVASVLREPLGEWTLAPGFSLPLTHKRIRFEQEQLPEEFLPTGSGAKASFW